MTDTKTISANIFLKGLAILMLYVLLGHPSAYVTIWERRNWYVIVLGIIGVPILLQSCANVLVWRVRISSSAIEIRSLRGVLKRQLADVANVERTPGRILVAFKDGSQRTIPSLVGNLDRLSSEIESRCGSSLKPDVRRHDPQL